MKVIFLIKQIRKKENMTLKRLSQKTGISTSHLNDIENNLKQPSFEIIFRISPALQVELNQLYEIERKPP